MTRVSSLIGLAVAIGILASPAAPLAAESTRTTHGVVAARTLVVRFFGALEAYRYREACSMLGRELRDDNRGLGCPTFLKIGAPSPLRWRVLGTRPVQGELGVIVELGQNELDHVRMRTWLAIVSTEGGALRIVETRLLR